MLVALEGGTIVVATAGGCVTLPGWSAVVVACLLTAPRLVKEFDVGS